MGQIIRRNIQELLPRADSIELIAQGPTSSGPFHPGTLNTLLTALLVMSQNSHTRLDVMLMDQDFSYQDNMSFVPVKYRENLSGRNLTDVAYEESVTALSEMSHFYGVDPSRITVTRFSDYVKGNNELVNIVNALLRSHEGRRHIKQTLVPNGKSSMIITPSCPECFTANTKPPTIKCKEYKFVDQAYEALVTGISQVLTLRAECNNEGCGLNDTRYYLPFNDLSMINFHYISTFVTDLDTNYPKFLEKTSGMGFSSKHPVGLHILGGDFDQSYGSDRTSKVERVKRFLTHDNSKLLSQSPAFYITPLFTFYGMKMSKSKGGTDLTLQRLREFYPYDSHGNNSGWVGRLDHLIFSNNNPVIEITEGNLFEDCLKY
jgi:hypothetical protein